MFWFYRYLNLLIFTFINIWKRLLLILSFTIYCMTQIREILKGGPLSKLYYKHMTDRQMQPLFLIYVRSCFLYMMLGQVLGCNSFQFVTKFACFRGMLFFAHFNSFEWIIFSKIYYQLENSYILETKSDVTENFLINFIKK